MPAQLEAPTTGIDFTPDKPIDFTPDSTPQFEPPQPTPLSKEAEKTVLETPWYKPPPEFSQPLVKLGSFLFSHPSPELRDRIAKGDKAALQEAGIAESLSKNIDALSTPENLTLMGVGAGIGALGSVARRGVAAAFAYLIGKNVPEIATQLGSELGKNKDDQDPKKISELVTDAAVSTGLTAALGAGAVKPVKPSEVPSAETIRSDEGQVPPPRTQPEVSQEKGGQDIQQPTPGPPNAPPQAEVLLKPTVTETTPPVPPEEMPKVPSETGLYPAVREVGGKVDVGEPGETHPQIIKAEGLKAEDVDQRGFVDAQGKFKDREQAAAAAPQVPTEREPERLHSTDLPEAKGGGKRPAEMSPKEYLSYQSKEQDLMAALRNQMEDAWDAMKEGRSISGALAREHEFLPYIIKAAKRYKYDPITDRFVPSEERMKVSKKAWNLIAQLDALDIRQKTEGQTDAIAKERRTATADLAKEMGFVPKSPPELSGPGTPAAAQSPELSGPGTPSIGQGPDIVPVKAPILSRLSDSVRNISTTLKGLGGYSLPKITSESGPAGEAGVRYASSRIAARPLAKVFETGTLEGTGVDPVEFGAALTEDNLRSVRKGFESQAKDLSKKGDAEGAAAAGAAAQQVHSIVGGEKSPFPTEKAYQDYLQRSEVQKAIRQHIEQWQAQIDPQFKAAQDIDPDTELATRGLQTGARINLKAIQEGEQPVNPVRGTGASLTATFKKKSPFGRQAKGSGQAYETNYGEIIHNTFHRQLEIANKNLFDKALVESGNAAIAPPGQVFQIGGEGTTAFPLQRRIIIRTKDGKTQMYNKGENIYVRNSLASEYRSASNVDRKFSIPYVTEVMNFLNKAALAGLTDATVHVSNQMTALFSRPVSGGLLTDSLLSATGRADVPVTIAKAIFKSLQNNEKQLSELAEIGALREHTRYINPLGQVLGRTDRITRLLLDDTFKRLADAGLVEKTETARREYVNQIGQYNRRLQGPLTRFFRDTGFGPFVTAGKTFNALGIKNITLSPGAKASNALAAGALRANLVSKWVGAAVTIGTLNYLITSKKGGGVMGRPGVPIGSIDSGKDDKQGRPLSIPALDILGLGRGLRVSGVRGIAQSKYLGLPNDVAFDAAARDIINSAAAPFAGPGPRFAKVSATGTPIAINVGRVAPVVPPGKNQTIQNIQSAAIEANPLIKSIYAKAVEGKSWREAVAGQLPRFTLTSGKPPEMVENYPEIVHKAQLGAYLDYVVHQARKMSDEERGDYLQKVLDQLDVEDLAQAQRTFKWRKVQ